MSAFRISSLAAAALWIGTAALAQDDATAPPRSLSHLPPPAAEQDRLPSGVLSEEPADAGEPPADAEAPAPPAKDAEQPPEDVLNLDTSDLASDVPEPERVKPGKNPKANVPSSDAVQSDVVPLPPPPPRTSIQVKTLGALDAPAEGLLDSGNGGLGEDMWSGSARGDVEMLLPQVPLASPDTAVRALAKRVVLTKSSAPDGAVKRPLITIRLEKLMAAGLLDDAGALAASGSLKDDPDFARVQASAILSAGRASDACGNLTLSRESESGVFWLQLRAYCAAASGDSATAEITRNLIEAQLLGDKAYDVLVQDALTGAKKAPGPVAKPTAMHLFLLRKAGLPVGGDVAKALGVGASVLALRDAKNTPEVRLAAAERALKAGAATTAELKAVADAQVIPPDKIAGAAADAPKLSFLAGQALLRRAAQLESRPGAKAALVHQALLLGDKAGLFETAARLQADVAAAIDPRAAAQGQGPLIGWALLLAGKSDAASHWLGDNDIATAVLDLVSGKDDLAQAALSNIAAKPQSQTFEVLVLGLYDALGLAMPADAKQAAKAAEAKRWPGRRPDDTAMRKIAEAAAAPDRGGEAVLRILIAVGSAGPRDLAPDVAIALVRALEDMGLKEAARAFAIHALLLYRP
jgi:hypothetical protein